MLLEYPPIGCRVFSSTVFADKRGTTYRFNNSDFETCKNQQIMIVTNVAHTLRGIHVAEYGKKVMCISGSVYDVMIDLRKTSNTYGSWYAIELTQDTAIYIPAGIGHAYYSHEPSTILYDLEGSSTQAGQDKSIHFSDVRLNITWPINMNIENLVISDKDNNKENTLDRYELSLARNIPRVLVYGANGYLGSHACKYLEQDGMQVIKAVSRCENRGDIIIELNQVKPDYVLCSVGKSGIPASVWHEQHPWESIENNLIAVLNLARACHEKNIRCAVFGTGFVYTGGTREEPILDHAPHNPSNNFYSHMRSIVEKTLTILPNVLVLRINYPYTLDADSRSLYNKIKNYTKLHDVKSSCTHVEECFQFLGTILRSDKTGAINFVSNVPESPLSIARTMNRDPNTYEVVDPPSNLVSCVLDTAELHSIIGIPMPCVYKTNTIVCKCEMCKNNNSNECHGECMDTH